MSPKMRNKHAFSPGVLHMYEIMSCFITASEPEMLLYDKQLENYSDLNDNYKI